jgi:predicted RNA binding protein with dsRBD fold (UPF0201 family)
MESQMKVTRKQFKLGVGGLGSLAAATGTATRTTLLPLVLIAGIVAGCASTSPLQYTGLASTARLAPNPQDKDGRIPFVFSAADVDWSYYTSVMLDPVTIYHGADQQFGGASDADKSELSSYMQTQFAAAINKQYALATVAGARTLRVHVTLTGAETSTPVLSTLTKVVPAGLVVNTVQTARGKQASFTGSVSFAVEIYDSESNRLLRAYVEKQYPGAENVVTSFGSLSASRAGIRNGSEDLLANLH